MTEVTPRRENLIPDLVAGLTTAIADIPDAMASAVLAGANPVYGLYASMVGKPVGGLLTSSHFMALGVTSALALTTGGALAGLSGEKYTQALFTLTLLVGVVQILAGLLKLGRLMRFVSNAVMVGFLTGVSALVVLSQLGDFSGYSSAYSNKVAKAVDLFFRLDEVRPQTFTIGLLTVILILVFDRTRLRNFSMLIAMVVASGAVLAFGWEAVEQVGDVAQIPRGVPFPIVPDLSLVPGLIPPAISLAIISLVQGAGISKAYPNPNGEYPDVSRDFTGQGAASAVASFFQGMPLGGSVASTALNVSAGARTRWANVFSGLIILVVVVLFSQAVGLVAMPAMAALLILAGIQSVKKEAFLDVWDVGWGSRIVMMVTFIMTLIVPVQFAVFGGVILSILVYWVSSSQDISLMEIIPNNDGTYRERPVPAQLPSKAVTLLSVSGNLFYVAAYNLEEMLPSAKGSDRPVVILRLRESDRIGSTFITVLEHYAAQLKTSGGKLILAGVNPLVKEQLELTETTQEILGEENVFTATENIAESTLMALRAAHAWLEDG